MTNSVKDTEPRLGAEMNNQFYLSFASINPENDQVASV